MTRAGVTMWNVHSLCDECFGNQHEPLASLMQCGLFDRASHYTVQVLGTATSFLCIFPLTCRGKVICFAVPVCTHLREWDLFLPGCWYVLQHWNWRTSFQFNRRSIAVLWGRCCVLTTESCWERGIGKIVFMFVCFFLSLCIIVHWYGSNSKVQWPFCGVVWDIQFL